MTRHPRFQGLPHIYAQHSISHLSLKRDHFLIRAPLELHYPSCHWCQYTSTAIPRPAPRSRREPSPPRRHNRFKSQSCSARPTTSAASSTITTTAVPSATDAIASALGSRADTHKHQGSKSTGVLYRMEGFWNGGGKLSGSTSRCQGRVRC